MCGTLFKCTFYAKGVHFFHLDDVDDVDDESDDLTACDESEGLCLPIDIYCVS